ncbi:MAG: NAD(P)-dependent oxidoreductase [Phycisphaerales bacterium]
MTTKPLILQTEHLDAAPAAWLAERTELVACKPSDPRFNDLLPKAHALVVRTYTRVDDALLSRATSLRCVGRAGVGLDNIDVEACNRRNIKVVHTPDANTQAVAEYTLCLLCDAFRPRTQLTQALSPENWSKARASHVAPRQLSELTIGVLGFGRIGSRVGQIASAVGAKVLYNDLRDIDAASRHNASPVTLDELLSRSDVLTIHIDPRSSNRHFINAQRLQRCKSNLTLLNTSRGMVIDHAALAAFLKTNAAARGYLDVHDPEPIQQDNPLLTLPNAHLYPHLAAATATAQLNMSWVVRGVWESLERSERDK